MNDGDTITRSERKRAAAIVERACIEFETTEEEIVGRGRRPWLTKARGAIAQSLFATGWTQLVIGALLGGRKPSTISTLINSAELRRRTDEMYDRQCRVVADALPPAVRVSGVEDVTLDEMRQAVSGLVDIGTALLRVIDAAQLAAVSRVRRAS